MHLAVCILGRDQWCHSLSRDETKYMEVDCTSHCKDENITSQYMRKFVKKTFFRYLCYPCMPSLKKPIPKPLKNWNDRILQPCSQESKWVNSSFIFSELIKEVIEICQLCRVGFSCMQRCFLSPSDYVFSPKTTLLSIFKDNIVRSVSVISVFECFR